MSVIHLAFFKENFNSLNKKHYTRKNYKYFIILLSTLVVFIFNVLSTNVLATNATNVLTNASNNSNSSIIYSPSSYSKSYIWAEIKEEKKNFIKWIDFKVSYNALADTSKIDIDTYGKDVHYNWIELLAYLACKNSGDFKNYSKKDLDSLIKKLANSSMEKLTADMKYYNYYYEAYSAILCEFLGEKEDGSYGVKAYLPIAKNYSFSHYKDFGSSRSYGFKRRHLGNDLMGSIGTPIIAVESGTIFHIGWNQYGGWRIGIRSFDEKRYYYYAHLRKDHPYVQGLEEGDIVEAGDVIGYLGMTGYSTKENVNNINVPHLHFGMQIIFDESQVEGNNEIWIDVYNIVEFLRKNKSSVYMSDKETKDYSRVN